MALITSVGFILLAIWLFVWGIMAALSIGNPTLHVLLGILAIVTSIFIGIGR